MTLLIVYLVLLALTAGWFDERVDWLDGLSQPGRYLAAFGVTLFGVNWILFGTFVVFGWTWWFWAVAWGTVLVPSAWYLRAKLGGGMVSPKDGGWAARWSRYERRIWLEQGWVLPVLILVAVRAIWGLIVIDGQVWCNFNYVDTAFHLSVANAFITASHFPPIDLDMAPYPLKYHFLADFWMAALQMLGAERLATLRVMNVVSAVVLVGSLWTCFRRWLGVGPRWTFLAVTVFLFLNTSLVNLLHYHLFNPEFFNPDRPFDGLLRFPFFNFESIFSNLFEPQRGLLFSFPVLLVIFHQLFGQSEAFLERRRRGLLVAFGLICLMPFGHIVGFAVTASMGAICLWPHFRWFMSRWQLWSVLLLIGLAQLYYLLIYGPPEFEGYSAWEIVRHWPEASLNDEPWWMRRVVFWFFVNGDFLTWGGLFIGAAAISRWRLRTSAFTELVWRFLVRWKIFFVVVFGWFLLVNFYRYTFDWGDSNKFVLFLNLGLAMVIGLGGEALQRTRWPLLSHSFWTVLAVVSIGMPLFECYQDLVVYPDGKTLLFPDTDREAAQWLRRNTSQDEAVLTSAYNVIHFVSSLAARPTVAGIYGQANLYRQPGRRELIKRIYETADFDAIGPLGVDYVCISGAERRRYSIHPAWVTLMRSGRAVAFSVGGVDDHYSVFFLKVSDLPTSAGGGADQRSPVKR